YKCDIGRTPGQSSSCNGSHVGNEETDTTDTCSSIKNEENGPTKDTNSSVWKSTALISTSTLQLRMRDRPSSLLSIKPATNQNQLRKQSQSEKDLFSHVVNKPITTKGSSCDHFHHCNCTLNSNSNSNYDHRYKKPPAPPNTRRGLSKVAQSSSLRNCSNSAKEWSSSRNGSYTNDTTVVPNGVGPSAQKKITTRVPDANANAKTNIAKEEPLPDIEHRSHPTRDDTYVWIMSKPSVTAHTHRADSERQLKTHES
ncbi:hypothetical protein RFI_02895, partial [Reticulomyxa filosa]